MSHITDRFVEFIPAAQLQWLREHPEQVGIISALVGNGQLIRARQLFRRVTGCTVLESVRAIRLWEGAGEGVARF